MPLFSHPPGLKANKMASKLMAKLTFFSSFLLVRGFSGKITSSAIKWKPFRVNNFNLFDFALQKFKVVSGSESSSERHIFAVAEILRKRVEPLRLSRFEG